MGLATAESAPFHEFASRGAGAPCLTDSTLCGPIGTEYCACFTDAEGDLVWACEEPPEGAR